MVIIMNNAIKTRLAQIRTGKTPEGYKRTPIGILISDWSYAKLNEIAVILTETAGKKQYETLSISAGIGFVNQAKKFGKELSGKQYEKYIVLHKGDFSYNKGNSKAYPQGCIYRLNDRAEAAVPNVFESFRIANGYPEYYEQLFIAGFLNSQLYRFINHGIRDDGLLNLTEKDFYSCIVPVPPLEEQQRIASILSAQDKIIELCERKIEQLKRMKKYYLQNMFPKDGEEYPEIRFKGFTDPWEQCKVSDVANRYDNLRIPVAANLRVPGSTPYYGANGIQDYVDGFTHEGEFVLVAEDGANDLKNYPVKCVNGRIWVNNHAHVLQSKPEIADNKFLAYSISQSDIESLLVGGGRAKLNAEVMMGIDLIMPSLPEQVAIGHYLTRLDSLITLHQRKCEEEKKKKKALQQLLLTGLVRV